MSAPSNASPFAFAFAFALAFAFTLAGCAGKHAATDAGAPLNACTADDAACSCSPLVDIPPFEGAIHVADGSDVTYQNNPPASGPHWPAWQIPWGPYPNGLARQRWVHNLEHGGVVLLYNCPDGCADDVAQLTALMNGRHPDQFNEVRILLVPDTEMPHRFAALAWRYRWQGEVIDTGEINCFIDARYDRGPESTP